MGRRVLPVVLALVALAADTHGSHVLALYALLGAVPFAAVAAIVAFGEFLEHRDDPLLALQTLLWGLAVVLLVLSCAARSPATATDTLPPLGWSALVACLGVFAVKACLAAAPLVRRLALVHPAKP